LTTTRPNPVTGLPYTLVKVDETPLPVGERLRTADTLQWKLWIQQYAWYLSIVTAAPGVALIFYTLTHNWGFSLGVTLMATITPGYVAWKRTRRRR
jgi:hypothetical protein